MAHREPVEVANLDIYGSPALPWSRPRDLLAAGPPQPDVPGGEFFIVLGTSRPDGRPHAAPIGALWHEGDLYFTSGPGTRKARNLEANPACTISVRLQGIDLVLEGEATRVVDRPTLERVAGGGGGRRVHGAVQRAERRPAALAPLLVHVPHGLRGRHRGAVRRDALARRPVMRV
jgi:hypothetical protein